MSKLAWLIALFVLLVPATASAETWTDVEAGLNRTCGTLTDGSVHCWGITDGRATPEGAFTAVSIGVTADCGIRADQTMACWGSDYRGEGTPLDPTWTWTEVSVGYLHSCGMRTTGELWCWGDNTYGARNPIAGDYAHVSVGAYYSCGIRTDGTIVCWGTENPSQNCQQESCQPAIKPPDGAFTQVAAGFEHTCALRTSGEIACWGKNANGKTDAPSGTFTQIDAGDNHTCAIRTDGTVACWGENSFGESTPPAGTFKKVSAGPGQTCGVRTDSSLVCWGSNDDGESTPRIGPDVTAPVLKSFRASPASFRAAKRGLPSERTHGTGTALRYQVSESASIEFTLLRRGYGRRVGGKCSTPTAANRRKAPCDLKIHGLFGTDAHRVSTTDTGKNTFGWNGRYWRRYPTKAEALAVGFDETRLQRTLAPGRYRLLAVAVDPAGNRSASKKVAVKIVKR